MIKGKMGAGKLARDGWFYVTVRDAHPEAPGQSVLWFATFEQAYGFFTDGGTEPEELPPLTTFDQDCQPLSDEEIDNLFLEIFSEE